MGSWTQDDLPALVHGLLATGGEKEWIEFKHNNTNPEAIGEYASALANSAALEGQATGYVVWGIKDGSLDVAGTTFKPHSSKGKGNEDLLPWLVRHLTPGLDLRFHDFDLDGHQLVVLEVPAASTQPVRWRTEGFVRVGSYKKKLHEHPEKERALWRALERTTFESGLAMEGLDLQGVLDHIDYTGLFDLLEIPHPATPELILQLLVAEAIAVRTITSSYSITNLGAILFAKRLSDFPSLGRKALRVIEYASRGKLETKRERVFDRGYAVGFESMVDFITGLLPSNEILEKALRKTIPMLPELALREVLANAMIHQDLTVTGTSPMVEIFEARVEITNPGAPLVETDRFLDSPPKSRNEQIAAMMRRVGYCEERGSGIDKVVQVIELFQLPAPLFAVPPGFTRVTLFAHQDLGDMTKEDKVRACYLHACLQYVQHKRLTNSSLRERFKIEDKNSGIATRLIRAALSTGMIRALDPGASRKQMAYLPFWAVNPA